MYRYLTLFFLLLISTCGCAQLVVTPAALQFLADQLPEMALSGDRPFADVGPTRLAYADGSLRWNPNQINVNWSGSNATGTFDAFRNALYGSPAPNYRGYFSGAQDRRALFFSASPEKRHYPQISLQHTADQRPASLLYRERNALGIGAQQQIRSIYLYEHLNFSQENRRRPGGFGARQQRLKAVIGADQTYNYNDLDWSANLIFQRENVERSLISRQMEGTRNLLEGQFNLQSADRRAAIQYGGHLALGLVRDRYNLLETERLRRDERAELGGLFQFDYHPFRFRFAGKYRYHTQDESRLLPEISLSWYLKKNKIKAELFSSRAGAYRDPLFSEEQYSYTLRQYRAVGLQTEDFQRYGFLVQSQYKVLNFRVEGVFRDYQRYTAVSYTEDGFLEANQLAGVNRNTLTAEVLFRKRWGEKGIAEAAINYRLDDSDFGPNQGILRPGRHAGWGRLYGKKSLDRLHNWYASASLSYLSMSPVAGVDGRSSGPRDRADFDLRLDFKTYWLAFRGEQFLRRTQVQGNGTDLAAFGGLPLGSEYAILSPRLFSLALGIGM